MNFFKRCLNPKVLASLSLMALSLYFVLSPLAFSLALPVLLAAACPLSMLLMLRLMSRGTPEAKRVPAGQTPLSSALVPTSNESP